MQVYSYDHIHLRSPNPAETALWYERMFDAKIIETPQPSGPNRVDLDINGLMVFIAGAMPQGEEIQGLRDPHYGLDHFGLRVENLDEAITELKAKGAEFAVESRTMPSGLKISFLRGPDGVRVEVVERPGSKS